MKLLYAEDERAMSEAVVDILTYHKYIVDAVYDGEDAYFYAKSEQYDGMILDIMMPKMSGLEVLKRLRREGCGTPILLLTAKAEIEDQVEGLDLGADDYLPKPFPMELLLARVRAMLRRREELLAIEEDRLAGRVGCTLDELDAYLDDIIAEEWQVKQVSLNLRR